MRPPCSPQLLLHVPGAPGTFCLLIETTFSDHGGPQDFLNPDLTTCSPTAMPMPCPHPVFHTCAGAPAPFLWVLPVFSPDTAQKAPTSQSCACLYFGGAFPPASSSCLVVAAFLLARGLQHRLPRSLEMLLPPTLDLFHLWPLAVLPTPSWTSLLIRLSTITNTYFVIAI